MNIEAGRIPPPRRARFLRLVIAAAVSLGATTASTVILDSGASQRAPRDDIAETFGAVTDADWTDVAAADAAAPNLPVDIAAAPSTVSLLYAPLAAGVVFCCFGWVTTRFNRRPTRSSAQTPGNPATIDLEVIAPRAARHDSSDSIAA